MRQRQQNAILGVASHNINSNNFNSNSVKVESKDNEMKQNSYEMREEKRQENAFGVSGLFVFLGWLVYLFCGWFLDLLG